MVNFHSSDRPEQEFQQARFTWLRSQLVELFADPNPDLSTAAIYERMNWLTQCLLMVSDQSVVTRQEMQVLSEQLQVRQDLLSQNAEQALRRELKRLEHHLDLSAMVQQMRVQQRYVMRMLTMLAIVIFMLAAYVGYLLAAVGDLRHQLHLLQ